MPKNHFDTLPQIQALLSQQGLDGWLLYDFRRSNDLACRFLGISQDKILTRRFFYWIPAKGMPVKIVNVIEIHNLDHLPGQVLSYKTWQEFEIALAATLKGSHRIAMEYSPRNALPYVSKVDAGTMELVRGHGVDVVSSADLLQSFSSVWTPKQLETHLKAAEVLSSTVEKTWRHIAASLQSNKPLTEYEVQQFMREEMARQGCVSSDSPICAVNAHSANPHYSAEAKHSSVIQAGDFILIDLWCKQDLPDAVYADITRVGVAASQPTRKQSEIFAIVKKARDAATDLVRSRFAEGKVLKGYEVDQCCRKIIADAGYGDYFVHRTGHNIDVEDHGNGAHLDSLETMDQRQLLPGTCFSIEPGIYLPGEFGVRLEYDIYVYQDGKIEITGGVQEHITCLKE